VLDAILFEREGIPAVAIVTHLFEETGRAMAQAWGVPEFKFLTMPHPIANLTEEELDQRAEEIVPKIADFFLKRHQ
jgi:hypothetical protein